MPQPQLRYKRLPKTPLESQEQYVILNNIEDKKTIHGGKVYRFVLHLSTCDAEGRMPADHAHIANHIEDVPENTETCKFLIEAMNGAREEHCRIIGTLRPSGFILPMGLISEMTGRLLAQAELEKMLKERQ